MSEDITTKKAIACGVDILRRSLVDLSRITHVSVEINSHNDMETSSQLRFWNRDTVTGLDVYLNDLQGDNFEINTWYEVAVGDYVEQMVNSSIAFDANEYPSTTPAKVIFKEDNISLVIGDKLTLIDSGNDEGFYFSGLGKLFKEGKCDKALIEVKEHPWLEVYFELTLEKDNKALTVTDLYDEEDDNLYTEESSFAFLRYTLSKGAVKVC